MVCPLKETTWGHDEERDSGEVDLQGDWVDAFATEEDFRVDILGVVDGGGGDGGCEAADGG